VTITRNSAGLARVFINGTQISQQQMSTAASIPLRPGIVVLGQEQDGIFPAMTRDTLQRFSPGRLSNVNIYDKVSKGF
jgi:hypothetical protein